MCEKMWILELLLLSSHEDDLINPCNREIQHQIELEKTPVHILLGIFNNSTELNLNFHLWMSNGNSCQLLVLDKEMQAQFGKNE